jgi:hypothetical protein
MPMDLEQIPPSSTGFGHEIHRTMAEVSHENHRTMVEISHQIHRTMVEIGLHPPAAAG